MDLKFGFYTDIHWAGKSPIRRLDDYLVAVERKHKYIYERAEQEGCTFMVSGGDINETPLIANSIVNRQIEVMKGKNIPEYAIYGNHDVIGNNAEKAEQVSASILFTAGYLKHIGNKEPVRIEEDGVTIALFGIDVHKDMDNLRPRDYYVKKPEWADFCILVAHGWLTEKEISIEGLHHTTFSDVVDTGTEADLILTGHFHPGYPTKRLMRMDGKTITFHSPGSPVRVKATTGEMSRKVGFSIIHVSKGGIDVEFVEFPPGIARPAEEILDRASLEEEARRAEVKEQIQARYDGINFTATSPKTLVMEIAAKSGLPKEALDDLSKRIEDAEMNEAIKSQTYEV